MSKPAIPARCAARPTVGGLVVPAISVVLANGRPVLGAVHRTKAMRCITGYLCQICEQPLTRPLVVLVSERQLSKRYSPEAALHPECAAYSMSACPMLAGTQETYRHSGSHIGSACSEPGCQCAGWVDADQNRPDIRGEPAGQWYAVWLDDYEIAITDRREVHGLAWRGITPRRVRPIPGTTPKEAADVPGN